MATKISGPTGPVNALPARDEAEKPAAPARGDQGDVDSVEIEGSPAPLDGGGDGRGRAELLEVLAPGTGPRDRGEGPATPREKMEPRVKDLVGFVSGEPRLKGVSKMSDAELMDEILGWMDDINLD